MFEASRISKAQLKNMSEVYPQGTSTLQILQVSIGHRSISRASLRASLLGTVPVHLKVGNKFFGFTKKAFSIDKFSKWPAFADPSRLDFGQLNSIEENRREKEIGLHTCTVYSVFQSVPVFLFQYLSLFQPADLSTQNYRCALYPAELLKEQPEQKTSQAYTS